MPFQGRWDVQKDNDQSEGCILQVYMNVAFSKKTMWKGLLMNFSFSLPVITNIGQYFLE